jgi:hypothetical protein
MNLIKELFSTANAFLKLEKVEIGGVKGKYNEKENKQTWDGSILIVF